MTYNIYMVGNVGHLWDMHGTCLDNLWETPWLTWETSMVDDLSDNRNGN